MLQCFLLFDTRGNAPVNEIHEFQNPCIGADASNKWGNNALAKRCLNEEQVG